MVRINRSIFFEWKAFIKRYFLLILLLLNIPISFCGRAKAPSFAVYAEFQEHHYKFLEEILMAGSKETLDRVVEEGQKKNSEYIQKLTKLTDEYEYYRKTKKGFYISTVICGLGF